VRGVGIYSNDNGHRAGINLAALPSFCGKEERSLTAIRWCMVLRDCIKISYS